MKLYILYENQDWLDPLQKILRQENWEFEACFVNEGHLDLSAIPKPGIYLNRLSASSATRDHQYSLNHGEQIIHWLEAAGCRVINGSTAIALEKSKFRQYLCLQRWQIPVPKSIAVTGERAALAQAATAIDFPFIYKYNCGGKGLGVQLIRDADQWRQFLQLGTWRDSPDTVHILQQYIESREPFITRCEFIGGKFHYAIQADTSKGFELCPAQGCEIDRCALGEEQVAIEQNPGQSIFRLRRSWHHPIIQRYEAMLQAEKIDVAGIEFLEDREGKLWTYDINCNTNYSPKVEAEDDVIPGLQRLTSFLREQIAMENGVQS
ncbi:MAG: ATP-grasp domain-containing protein [Oligoflexus sp.]